jgi:ribosomal protein L6P/L9E
MSRVGKKIIDIPSDVTVTFDGQTATVKGSSLESVGLTTSRVFSSCLKVILSSKVLVNSPLGLKVN